MNKTYRLDEFFQELNDTPENQQLLYIQDAIKVSPLIAPLLKEAYSYFDWGDFPIEEFSKDVAKWNANLHWSVAPNKGLSKATVDLIDKVIKNPKMDMARRKERLSFFLKNLCNEESEVLYLILTKNLVSKYPNISADTVLTLFPELTVNIK